MTNPNDLAFSTDAFHAYARGLTKREYFAAMMMNATAESIIEFHNHDKKNQAAAAHIIAAYWVCMADALIAELNKEPKNEA